MISSNDQLGKWMNRPPESPPETTKAIPILACDENTSLKTKTPDDLHFTTWLHYFSFCSEPKRRMSNFVALFATMKDVAEV
mmetsp:Transcript_5836/g.11578  ORF Transcript_5836/g.11578 Transcript_5836/m.11578 type:complete len:81 (+) Transcript_5836:1515-1757(+)